MLPSLPPVPAFPNPILSEQTPVRVQKGDKNGDKTEDGEQGGQKKPAVTCCYDWLYEVERRRIELPTCTLRTYRSPKLSYRPGFYFYRP